MYRHILVPVAYEPGIDAGQELAAARQLASPGGRVTLLHAMDPVPPLAIDYLPQGWRAELIAALEADLARQAETVPGGTIALVEGEPARAILDFAEAEDVDCIVMASHRIDTALFGSTAARVVRHAPCTVHLLR
jgi:nucleotide-binding universal stress UspA family protein